MTYISLNLFISLVLLIFESDLFIFFVIEPIEPYKFSNFDLILIFSHLMFLVIL